MTAPVITPTSLPPRAEAKHLTQTLVRLKLTLTRNRLKRSVWAIVGTVLGALYGLFWVALMLAGLVALRFTSIEIAADATTVLFAVGTIGWILFPLLLFGQDATVDPARFSLLPLRARDLQPGLLLSGLVGVPGIATALTALGLLGTWSIGPGPLVATVLAIAIGVPLCVLWSRTVLTWLASLLSGRRTRDVTVVLFMVLIMGFPLGAQGIGRVAQDVSGPGLLRLLSDAAQVLGWTPFGWIWAVPGAVAQGDLIGAGVRLALALLSVGALWLLWRNRLALALTSPLESGGDGRTMSGGTRLQRMLPASTAGAITWRCLLYWRRDPRYLVALISLIIAPVIIIVSLGVNGQLHNPGLSFVVILITWLGGLSTVSELAYDHSALSTHVLTGVRGRDDRVGRVIAYGIIVGVIAVVVLLATLALNGRWDLTPAVLGLGLATFGAGAGAGLWVGTLMPGKGAPPGANPLSAGNSGNLRSMLGLGLATLISLIPVTPVAILAVLGVVLAPWWGWLALALGLLVGAGSIVLGVRLGGTRLDARWPEILAEVAGE